MHAINNRDIKGTHDSPITPWKILPPSCLFEGQYLRKDEFLSISKIIINAIGMPTATCLLAGNIIGASNWEGVSIEKQYLAITESAGVFEASAMTYLRIKGADAANVLNMLTPRDIHRLKPGHAMFVIFTTPLGTVDDEAIVLRTSENEFLLSCGGCKPSSKPLSYLHQAIHQFPDVVISSPDLVSFNIKGPKRITAMMRLLHPSHQSKIVGLSDFQFCQANLINGDSILIAKTKIGIEMWGELRTICWAWSYMLNQPAIYTPCGWDILHPFRMDCNDILFSLYPIDIHCGTSLWEIGCDWMIKEKDCDYIGKQELTNGKNRKIFNLKKIYALSKSSNPAKAGSILNKENGDFAGYITSSAFSFNAERAAAFAHLSLDYNPDEMLYIEKSNEQWGELALTKATSI